MSMNLIFMGLPGAGKGTQSPFIVKKYGIPHISTGDIFREAMNNKTAMGLKAKKYIDKGNLVPDDVTCGIVKDRLSRNDVKKGYILDGFPRTVNQAKSLENMTADMKRPLSAVIYIKVDLPLLIKRLSGRFMCKKCGATYNKLFRMPKVANTCDRCGGHEFFQRSDDQPKTVKNRLRVGKKTMKPLLDFYRQRHLLHIVDGHPDIDQTKNMYDVNREIQKVLNQLD